MAPRSITPRISRRRALAAAIVAAPLAGAWRFALAYRARAGIPKPRAPVHDPADLGLAFESISVPSEGLELPAWWIPAGPRRGPAVVLVHGWESARDRTLPNALVLHAAGFHVLTFDVRGQGANQPETLAVTAGEFGADAAAAVKVALARPEVTTVALVGHSMGGAGALLAAAAEPRVAAVVTIGAPAGPYRLTRHTFRLAHLPIPNVVAYPLAWLTTRVYVRPRGHSIAAVSAVRAIRAYRGPVLIVHARGDEIIPVSNAARLARVARRARQRRARQERVRPASLRLLILDGGNHSWLYERADFRGGVARFLAAALGGPLTPDEAAAAAIATNAERLPDPARGFSAIEDEPGGIRTIVSALRHPAPRTDPAPGAG